MQKIVIKLNEMSRVKNFVETIAQYSCDCDIASESRRYIVDAKSIMGIFSLNLNEPLTLMIHSDGPEVDEIVKDIQEYIA